jgi:hypothetical protein
MSGNEANEHVARKLRELATPHRAALLGALECIFRAKVTTEYGITYQGKRAN